MAQLDNAVNTVPEPREVNVARAALLSFHQTQTGMTSEAVVANTVAKGQSAPVAAPVRDANVSLSPFLQAGVLSTLVKQTVAATGAESTKPMGSGGGSSRPRGSYYWGL